MKRPSVQKLATMLVLSLVSAGLLACGGSDDSTMAAKAPTTTSEFPLADDRAGDAHVRYVADPSGDFAYNITEASASAGIATLELVNSQNVPHNVVIEGPKGETIGETDPVSEDIASTTVVLKPGVYRVYCSVPGHRKAGMKGHLTVLPPYPR